MVTEKREPLPSGDLVEHGETLLVSKGLPLVGHAVPSEHVAVAELLREIVSKTRDVAQGIRLLFVTNLRSRDITDVGPTRVMNEAQYYSRRQADEIVRVFQELGVTVEAFYSEVDFLRAVSGSNRWSDGRQLVVFTTAEGGKGSGRRALVPAVCNLLSLPFLNSGAHASSLARHKFHSNSILQQAGVRAPATWQFNRGCWSGNRRPPKGSCVIVKPMYESMCIGVDEDSVQIVDEDFETFALCRGQWFGQPVLVQEFISGEEVTVPLMRLGITRALPAITYRRASGTHFGHRPRTFQSEIVDQDYSYAAFQTQPAQYAALLDAGILAFDALEMGGVGRIDFRVDADGRPWVIDTNESPPPLGNTSYALAMELLGFTLSDMFAVWLGICLADFGAISISGQTDEFERGRERV